VFNIYHWRIFVDFRKINRIVKCIFGHYAVIQISWEKQMRTCRALTLIELLVVIAIICTAAFDFYSFDELCQGICDGGRLPEQSKGFVSCVATLSK
jgi:prepilin-type N-terminal cleavage/methylation domain-containing protein